jgi:hypothetical protein
LQLVIGDAISNTDVLRDCEFLLQQMITIGNYGRVKKVMNSRCPRSVPTRWLSRCAALEWVLKRQNKFLTMRAKMIKDRDQRLHFQEFVNGQTFAELGLFHRLLSPLNDAVKFFEQDSTCICHVHPALRSLKHHLQAEAAHSDGTEYAECCRYMVERLKVHRHKHLDLDLVKAAFWLTSFGAGHLDTGGGPVAGLFEVGYHAPVPFPAPVVAATAAHSGGPMDRFIPRAEDVEDSEDGGDSEDGEDSEDENDIDDQGQEPDVDPHAYQGDFIDDRDVGNPQPIRGSHEPPIDFLIRYLHQQALLSDENSESANPEAAAATEERVIAMINLFFGNEAFKRRARYVGSSIEKQVELWNSLAMNEVNHSFDDLVRTVISVISIPASEASCERCFSRQKRIMGHHRARSEPDLLNARVVFQGDDLPW